MAERHDPDRFASRLLRQDEPLSDSQYQQYRGKLEDALRAAERREKLTGRVVAASCVVMFALMFVGGSKLLGDFDPWSKGATPVSVAAGVVYFLAAVTFLLSSMAYFWRFRPGVKGAKERLRDATILDLQRQVRELRELAERDARRDEPDADTPSSG